MMALLFLLRRRLPNALRSIRRSCVTRRSYSSEIGPARTRFAPSPTGFLHLGSLRTALFNYLLAKKTGGQFIIRIEDTDKKRTVGGAEKSIYETLRWAGLTWDEGPDIGGPHGPYKQSKRADIHRHYAEALVDQGYAYRCYCTTGRLQALAKDRSRSGTATNYDRTCLHTPPDDTSRPYVIRLQSPKIYPAYDDLVYGVIKPGSTERLHRIGMFEDPILLKSNGVATYHLANVVDDHLMGITHVIRATEWMPSTPKHLHLYSVLGWTPPQFAHVALLTNFDKHKLSKRTGSVFVSHYRTDGYINSALLNFVALLGWSHGRESDVMTLPELVQEFDLSRLTEGDTVVHFSKLEFLQRQHARATLSDEEIMPMFVWHVRQMYSGVPERLLSKEYIAKVLKVNKQNFSRSEPFAAECRFFFRAPEHELALEGTKPGRHLVRDIELVRAANTVPMLEKLEKLQEDRWTVEELTKITAEAEGGNGVDGPKSRMRFLRFALTGGEPGPSVNDTMELLGRDESLKRIQKVREILEV